MEKYVVSNIIFTAFFLSIILPLGYLIHDYAVHYGLPPKAAAGPLEVLYSPYSSINRDFTDIEKYATKVPVLMYHQIIPKKYLKKHHFLENGELDETIVTLENFKRQMKYLKDQNYTVLSLKEFELYMTAGKKIPDKSVLITFDDGYKNVFEFAYPVLKEHEFYAVHFLITGLITHEKVSYKPTLYQYANIEEVERSSDVFDYGNHTHLFHQRNKENAAFLVTKDITLIKSDINQANQWLGQTIAFAAPYGEYNKNTLEILNELHTKIAFTVKPGYADPSLPRLEIPRWYISPKYSLEDFKFILGE